MTITSRRDVLRSASAAGIVATGLAGAAFAKPARPFRIALSVSPFTESVLAEAPLSDGKGTARTVADVQRMFVRHGANEVYQRIACRKVSPQGHAEHGWARGIERAALARQVGLPFNPEIGIFANYGDVANYQEAPDFTDYPQIRLPAPWHMLTIDQMLPPLRQYGAAVAHQILRTGVRVNFWDVGNEVELGVAAVTPRPLVPTDAYRAPDAVDPAIGRMEAKTLFAMREVERIAWCRAHLWPHLARLLGALADGIRSVDRAARFSTHISGGSQVTPAIPVAFWDAMRRGGFLPDQLGQSIWGTQGLKHGGPPDTFAWLRDTASELHRRFARPMFLAEFGFASAPMAPPFDWNDLQKGYPQTERGQHDYIRDVAAWAARTGHISGIRPWAPDYHISPVWANMSLFRRRGDIAVAKPGLSAIRQGVARARRRAR
jgi:hypothetical protein